jgi:hypothetical protein
VNPDSDPRLPRSPRDSENLRRLREEALCRVEEEERASAAPVYAGPLQADDATDAIRVEPAVIYGGPPPNDDRPAPERDEPAPVYGGPPPFGGGGSATRRRTLWALILAALAAIVGIVTWLLKARRIFPQETAQSSPPAPVYGGPPIRPPQPPSPQPEENGSRIMVRAIRTRNGHLVTAVNGGGLGDPHSAPHGVALSTGATTAGPFETFTLIRVNKVGNTFALKTHDGHFVTAVNGGGIGGPDSSQSPVHADATDFELWGSFTITLLPDNLHATIRTADGKHFLSAVNGGGVGGSNKVPFHTDATTLSAAAVFQLVPARPPQLPQATVYGGPTR